MIRNSSFDFSHLTAAERIQLAEDLWDSLVPDADALPVPPEHLAELERRLADPDEIADDGVSWEELRETLLHNLQRGG
jgi:putative addiction module component (TIGR02574 family)